MDNYAMGDDRHKMNKAEWRIKLDMNKYPKIYHIHNGIQYHLTWKIVPSKEDTLKFSYDYCAYCGNKVPDHVELQRRIMAGI